MNAFVTGGSRGIGRAIVLKLAHEGYGCAFTYVGNQSAAEETAALAKEMAPQSRVQAYKLDVKDPAQVDAVVEQAIDDFETIGVAVNNAGIVRNNAAVFMSDEEWDLVIRTNLCGPFYVIRSLLMHFVSNRAGRIINISSISQDGSSGQVNYAASKAGLVGLTNTIAREYGVKGITANIVVVGYVETDMTEDHLAQQLYDNWLLHCPMKRIGTAE